MIPVGWQIKEEVSVNNSHLDLFGYAMEEKERIPGGWNRQMKVNNTQCDSGRVERMRRRTEIISG